MADRIQQRRDTAARWAQYNPILLEGEVGYVTDDPNQYKIGDGVHAWNELPLRGFDGTLVHELGTSETAAMSQKGVTKAVNACNRIVPMIFPQDTLTKIETTYTEGLLVRNTGSVDLNQTSFRTSDYIEVDTNNIGVYVYYTPNNFVASTFYASLCAYDADKNFLQAFPIRTYAGYFPFYFNENVKYIRISSNQTNIDAGAGLYYSREFDLYSSYKSEREKIKNLTNKVTDLNSANYDTIFPFSFGKWEKFETTYEVGLLNTSGNVDTSFENFRTSDFIELFTSQIMKKQVFAFSTDTVNSSAAYLIVAFYDRDKKYISGIKASDAAYIEVDTTMSDNAKYVVKVPIDAAYARITCRIINGEINQNVGLFHGALVSLDYFLSNLNEAVEELEKNTVFDADMYSGMVDLDNTIEATYYWNQRNDETRRVNANGYVMAVIGLSEEDEGKLLFVNCRPSQYVSGLRFYSSRAEDDSFADTARIWEGFTNDSQSPMFMSGGVRIPKGARAAVLQANISAPTAVVSTRYEGDRIKSILSASFTHRKYITENDDTKARAEYFNSEKNISGGIDAGVFYSQFDNFIDRNNLVGEYRLGERVNENGFITANNFSCLLIKNIGNHKFLNVCCNASQYVPGVQFFNTDDESKMTNYYLISSSLIHNDFSPVSYRVQIRIPDGTKAVLLQAMRDNNNDDEETTKKYLAASFTSEKIVSKNDLDELSYWADKNIWWCGTSIPAATTWNVDNANSYPLMTGAILGAKRVFNEAVGSSCAAASNAGGTYEVVSRRMGDTIQRKLAIFNDCWTVDDEAQTVVNGPRSMGITSIPSVTTYQSACTYRMQILSHCYEIKLIAKYLLKDQKEHDAFLQEKFGSLYNTLITLHPTAYTYQADIDLFVIDHSNNDGATVGSHSDINSQDITTYVGALNTYVRLIQKYKPRATVVFISNYTDAPSGVIKTEGDIAANWHMPYCNLLERIPVGGRSFKITTRGYWDTDHKWHDDGFTWSDDGSEYTTNLDLDGMSIRVKGDLSLSQVKNNINPTLVDGKWYWDAYPNDIWMYDGLHPHSDQTHRCLKVYSQAIAAFLKNIGDGVY